MGVMRSALYEGWPCLRDWSPRPGVPKSWPWNWSFAQTAQCAPQGPPGRMLAWALPVDTPPSSPGAPPLSHRGKAGGRRAFVSRSPQNLFSNFFEI